MSLLDDLISHWPLDEESGARFDSHGTNHLTDNNTVGSAAGLFDVAASLDAANDEYFSLASNPTVTAGASSFTYATWLLGDQNNTSAAGKWGATLEWIIWLTGGGYHFYASVDGTTLAADAGVTHPGAGWHLLIVWIDADAETANIQVNNGPVISVPFVGAVFESENPLLLGANGQDTNQYTWQGGMDSTSFWKRVLTADERTQLYNSETDWYSQFAPAAARRNCNRLSLGLGIGL